MSRTHASRLVVAVLLSLVAFAANAGQENLLSWFRGGESTVIGSKDELVSLPTPLAEFVFSKFGTGDPQIHLPREDLFGCYGELPPNQYYYSLRLTNTGMEFVLPLTANYSCGEAIGATFDELKPFMNKKGLEYVAQFMKSSKPKRKQP